MTAPTRSYLKVPYDLRPGKQVERRMMFDALQILAGSGFPIGDYQYTGFGSIFFVDFTLFHKYLGLTRMLNVEHDRSIEKRVQFNMPFKLIDVQFKSAAEIIPGLSPDRQHILWLDYDDFLTESVLQDVGSAMSQLSAGSILLVTVDVEPPVRPGTPAEWESYFRKHAGPLIPHDWDTESYGLDKLPRVSREILRRAIDGALAYRDEVEFSPLFSFLYADGHRMYTLGGMLTTKSERRKLGRADFESAHYIRASLDEDPFRILVPNLTRRERLYLDAHMPAAAGWVPTAFELAVEDVDAYRDIYRFYPNYVEVF
jgi:hypothetical protein